MSDVGNFGDSAQEQIAQKAKSLPLPNFCACMGPLYGEPYCACEMRRRGLPRSQECIDSVAAAQKRLNELFGPGGEYEK